MWNRKGNKMKIFILDDDANCSPIIEWIEESFEVEYTKNIEDAVYYLEYEGGSNQCDKFIFDASVPKAVVVHEDGSEEAYDSDLNGIDFMISCFVRLGLSENGKNVAVLSAYDLMVKNYDIPEEIRDKVEIISKNDNDLIKRLQDFLEDH